MGIATSFEFLGSGFALSLLTVQFFFGLGSEDTLFERVQVFEQRYCFELDVFALEDVESGQAPQLVLEC